MKTASVFSVIAAGAVTIFLLGANPAQAGVVLDPDDPTKAIGIEDLNVGGTLYDVVFIGPTEAVNIYPNEVLDFNDLNSANVAIEAAAAALNAANVFTVGPTELEANEGFPSFRVGYEIFGSGLTAGIRVTEVVSDAGIWARVPDPDANFYLADARSWADFTLVGGTPPPPTDEVAIAASSLPSSRSVQVGSLASVFATIINGGSVTATDCSIAPGLSLPANFAYQTTDASNVPTGSPNTPADIAAGGAQNYIFGFVPTSTISPTEVVMIYDCTNSAPAPSTVGLNTLLLSASASPVPDIVALAATPTGDGILNLPGTNGANAFAVSTVNVGSTATIGAIPRLSAALPVALSICETNPATGACLSAAGSSAVSSVSAGATKTYSVFVSGAGTVPFDPVNNRIIVEFKDAGTTVRGSTSVAVRTQ